MPSRVHWVYMVQPNRPRFDGMARAFFQDQLRRTALETMSSLSYDRFVKKLNALPYSFRKAIPLLQAMAVEQGFTFGKKLRMFRLPKRLRKNKNPIHVWKNAA